MSESSAFAFSVIIGLLSLLVIIVVYLGYIMEQKKGGE